MKWPGTILVKDDIITIYSHGRLTLGTVIGLGIHNYKLCVMVRCKDADHTGVEYIAYLPDFEYRKITEKEMMAFL